MLGSKVGDESIAKRTIEMEKETRNTAVRLLFCNNSTLLEAYGADRFKDQTKRES